MAFGKATTIHRWNTEPLKRINVNSSINTNSGENDSGVVDYVKVGQTSSLYVDVLGSHGEKGRLKI